MQDFSFDGSGQPGGFPVGAKREIKRPGPMPKYSDKIQEWLDYADSINAYPSYRWLAKNIGCSVETVKKHMKKINPPHN